MYILFYEIKCANEKILQILILSSEKIAVTPAILHLIMLEFVYFVMLAI